MSDKPRVSPTRKPCASIRGKPGKLEISPTKPMATQRDLSLAYSPGVAVPVQAIADNAETSYDHLARQYGRRDFQRNRHFGAGKSWGLAAKPVMEGKGFVQTLCRCRLIDLELTRKTQPPSSAPSSTWGRHLAALIWKIFVRRTALSLNSNCAN